jgi:hypothetical protein
MKINAHEINRLDELTSGRMALDRSLQVALNYHANQTQELEKDVVQFWKDLGKKYGFDPDDGYLIKKVDGFMMIVRKPADALTAGNYFAVQVTAKRDEQASAALVFEYMEGGDVFLHKNRFGAAGRITGEQFHEILVSKGITIRP